MLNRKLYLLMMIMALLGLFLAACGSSEEEPEEGAETVTETTTKRPWFPTLPTLKPTLLEPPGDG